MFSFKVSVGLALVGVLAPFSGLVVDAHPGHDHGAHDHGLHVRELPWVHTNTGDSASAFPLNQVTLGSSRFKQNQDRTLNYLKSVNMERMLYNFRANHKLSTNSAQKNGGWDAPDFPFRSHFQGHLLSAWAQCYGTLGDATCRDRANYFVAELAKCQNNNGAAGFKTGYLSGFPESEIDKVEARTLTSGNVPYYAIHKTMAGLLDVWRILESTQARDVLLKMAAWVDTRTSALSYTQQQNMLGTEFGGMSATLADIFLMTNDNRWVAVARRFDHASVLDPLAGNQDILNGKHANTNIPKWIGAARTYKATGEARFKNVAQNAWNMTVRAHSYAIGGNSQSEHFRPPNAIAGYLTKDTAEACNTYNMLKLTRELWMADQGGASAPRAAYFDYYERALFNHLLGQQNPGSGNGHVTYFTPLVAGGRRGVGPAWGGGTFSTDYDSFWCCQGTGVETNTKYMDSIYFRSAGESTLFVNLFIPSTLRWTQKGGVVVTQTTSFPASDTTTLEVSGSGGGRWTLAVRVPSWVAGAASITVNGQAVSGVSTAPGTYASITRDWSAGDRVVVRLPMKLYKIAANDDAGLVAVAYGPTVLSGNYGNTALSATPRLDMATVKKTGTGLDFQATSEGKTVQLGPFYDAQGVNYVVYWRANGNLPS